MKNKKTLPAAELEVLASLKKLGQATARQIREDIHAYRPMAHGSIVNLLLRLEAKSLVARKKGTVGKAFIYYPTNEAGTVYGNVLGRLLNRVFGGDSLSLVSSLFETKPPDEEQIEGLERLLAHLKEKQKRRG
jgi:BlaI family penicillinase repressor